MNNFEIKIKFLEYFDKSKKEIEELEKNKFFFRSGSESRALLGVIQFLWSCDYISDTEREKFFDMVYDHISKARIALKHDI